MSLFAQLQPFLSCLNSQAPEPGRHTQRNAKAAGFGNFEVVDNAYADSFSIDKAGDGSPGVQMSSSKLICGYNDPQVQAAEKHIKKTLGVKPKVHSAAHAYASGCNSSGKKRKFVHANFHNSKNKMQKTYSEVGTKLDCNDKTGTEVWSSSAFQGAGTESKRYKKQKLFLKAHTDTHSLSTLFLSILEGESWVYYKTKGENGKVVAKLRIPAGFSVIVTSEIHSELIAFNPEGLEHWSETTHDRVMFRIVYKAPVGGLHMDRADTEWIQLADWEKINTILGVFPS